jgi:DNA-binding NtrC family response regulator
MPGDLTDRVRGGARALASPEPPEPGEPPGPEADDEPGDYKEHVRRYEAELILRALHKHNGNQTEAARALNLPLRTLVHKIQSYGIKKKFDR